MPGESWWNPYRFVPVRKEAVQRRAPWSHGRFTGLMGSIECWLQALTPLVVGQKQFIRRAGVPCIPGTSLKGVIRSTCELVGNGCASIGRDIDDAHKPCYTRNRLCITCRMFGFLKKSSATRGTSASAMQCLFRQKILLTAGRGNRYF